MSVSPGKTVRFWKVATLTMGAVAVTVVLGCWGIFEFTGGDAISPEVEAAALQASSPDKPAPTPAAPDEGPHTWWVGDADGQSCNSGVAPAENIHTLRMEGLDPQTSDHKDDQGQLTSVDITRSAGELGETLTTTFFRAKADCENALPGHQPIPDRYR